MCVWCVSPGWSWCTDGQQLWAGPHHWEDISLHVHEKVRQPLTSLYLLWSVSVVRCCGGKEEEDFRPLFDNFVQDLLTTLNLPEWPACEVLLTLLGVLLVHLVEPLYLSTVLLCLNFSFQCQYYILVNHASYTSLSCLPFFLYIPSLLFLFIKFSGIFKVICKISILTVHAHCLILVIEETQYLTHKNSPTGSLIQ